MDLITDKDVQDVQKQSKRDELLYYFECLNKRLDQHIEKIDDVFGKEVEPFPGDDEPLNIPF